MNLQKVEGPLPIEVEGPIIDLQIDQDESLNDFQSLIGDMNDHKKPEQKM